MTVSYTGDIANGGTFVSFWRVLIRWRGSLYKLIWRDLLCYCLVFISINCVHTYVLPPPWQLVLKKVRDYLSSNISLFPVPFVLSFFVDQVATKWWHQYQMLPSADTLAIYTNAAIPGKDDHSRIIRRTIVRYAVLSLVLTLRNISTRIRKRFPTIKHVEEAGLILEEETIHYDKLESPVAANNWMPLVWAANIATRARSLNKVSSDQCLRLLISELTAHRDKLGTLVGYDLVNIPLVYTQTMVVIVMNYIAITLISHQPFGDDSGSAGFAGFTLPSFTDFIIYVGLMKVATVMLNPFGEDDDDFELNASVDRHITAAYMIVDEMHEEEPEVVKDIYWDEIVPKDLPYTVGAMAYRKVDPTCYGEDSVSTIKTHKNQLNSQRANSDEENKAMVNDLKEVNRKNKNKENNLPQQTNNSLSKVHSYLNRDDEVDLYDYPDSIKPMQQLQQPSTSKQHFNQRKRY